MKAFIHKWLTLFIYGAPEEIELANVLDYAAVMQMHYIEGVHENCNNPGIARRA